MELHQEEKVNETEGTLYENLTEETKEKAPEISKREDSGDLGIPGWVWLGVAILILIVII